MTAFFYSYLVVKDRVKRILDWLEDGWWGFVNFFSTPKHEGATEQYAKVLHSAVEDLDRLPEVGLHEDDITAALDLMDALDAMEKSTVEQFNAGFEKAMEKFLASGEFGPVTDTGEHLMVKMEMSVWVNQQVDSIRSLGTEVTEACRNS